MAATASSAAAVVLAPQGGLGRPAVVLSPGPANGDLAAGLEGWSVEGRDPPLLLGPGARIVGNVTLVSPPLVFPEGSQTLRIAMRAGGGDGLVAVRARTDDGLADTTLAVLEPGPARRSFPVGVSALAGRTVRIVLDPTPALGTSLDLLRIGPVVAPLPGWSVGGGTLETATIRGVRVVSVTGAPLEMRSPAYGIPRGRGTRTVSVSVRGEGVLRISAAGRSVTRRAGAGWSVATIVLGRRLPGRIALGIVARPGLAGMELRALGAVLLRTPGRSGGSGSR